MPEQKATNQKIELSDAEIVAKKFSPLAFRLSQETTPHAQDLEAAIAMITADTERRLVEHRKEDQTITILSFMLGAAMGLGIDLLTNGTDISMRGITIGATAGFSALIIPTMLSFDTDRPSVIKDELRARLSKLYKKV